MTLFKKKESDFLHTDYFVLLLILSLGGAGYFFFISRPMLQAGVVVATCLLYIIWAIIHHLKEGDFHYKIILEYVLIAFLAIALLLTLIFRT
ncbi:hypothetical protein GYA19_02790 [Candidatus Beckwithbacteria bacterium]|nr:hypothetical protein [Candidatus Beckwithbacteria bacterium]